MKTIIFSKWISLASKIVIIVIVLGFQSCDEKLEELTDKFQTFEFDYQIIADSDMSTSTAMLLAENKDAVFLGNASTFLPVDPPSGGTGASNQLNMNGDPANSGSNFHILMERVAINDDTYPRTIRITSPQGPFSEGQVISDMSVEITTGLPGKGKTFSTGQPDTYSKFTITHLNSVAGKGRISGEFHFVVRETTLPLENDYLSGANGTFSFPF